MDDGGKGSKRRPSDEEAYADNYQRIFEQKVEWEDEMVKEEHDRSLATIRCRWCSFKQQHNNSVLCESCGKEVSV